MGKMPSMRQLRVSFPIDNWDFKKPSKVEGVSFAKDRRSHESVSIQDFDVCPVLVDLSPCIVVNNNNSESNTPSVPKKSAYLKLIVVP